MKTTIKGYEIECTAEEFLKLTELKQIKSEKKPRVFTIHIDDKKNARYTPQELRQIWELNLKGESEKKIAKQLGRTKYAIGNIIYRLTTKEPTAIKRMTQTD